MRFPVAESKLEPIKHLEDARGFTAGVDYCGITAIAAITGYHCKAVTQAAQRMRGSSAPIVGMTDSEIANLLGYLGYRADMFFIHQVPGHRVTLRKFWVDRKMLPASIVVVNKHYLALDWGRIVDTNTDGKTAWPDNSHPYMRHTVHNYFEVRKIL